MTIRILQKGPGPRVEKAKKRTCWQCRAKLEYHSSDVKIHRWIDAEGGGCEKIRCPQCHSELIIRSW